MGLGVAEILAGSQLVPRHQPSLTCHPRPSLARAPKWTGIKVFRDMQIAANRSHTSQKLPNGRMVQREVIIHYLWQGWPLHLPPGH